MERESLRERVAALKHDLGKYVAWTSANLEEAAWTGPVTGGLLEALRSDLLETRRRGDHVEAAWEVWSRLTEDLPRPLDVGELVEVERAVETLRSAESALRERDAQALARVRADIREAQQRIRRELSALTRRLAQE